ncbi:MAG: GAF domain-containing protein, partial [Anaerolineae bacterium]|nr:GAF domain-containing protein [Anaerolineae bacterium]
ALSTLLGVILILIINNQLIEPLARLTSIAEQFASGNLEAEVRFSRRPDEVGQLQRALSTMTDNLRQTISILEERVQARTRDLETTSTIAREAARQEDTNALLNHTVNLIVQNFPAIYHAQVFLVDPQNAYANLVASTGEAGRQLLAAGHRLAVGSVSVIGRVTELGETVIARDTATSSVHRRNEFLQDTQAEMALPLIYGDRVLGALDVQSKLAHAFTPEDQQVFNTLATELAIIINNAQQLATMQTQLTELETQSRVLSRTDWNQLLSANRRRGYLEARAGANDAAQAGSWSEWQQQAAAQKEVVASPPQPDDTVFLAVPVLSREDEVLGVIEWRVHRSRITDQSMRMAEQLARRLSNSMETVRLLERSQLLAERERLVNEISGKLTTEPSVAYILETAVNELSGILQTSRVNIQLKPSAAVPASGSSENK